MAALVSQSLPAWCSCLIRDIFFHHITPENDSNCSCLGLKIKMVDGKKEKKSHNACQIVLSLSATLCFFFLTIYKGSPFSLWLSFLFVKLIEMVLQEKFSISVWILPLLTFNCTLSSAPMPHKQFRVDSNWHQITFKLVWQCKWDLKDSLSVIYICLKASLSFQSFMKELLCKREFGLYFPSWSLCVIFFFFLSKQCFATACCLNLKFLKGKGF